MERRSIKTEWRHVLLLLAAFFHLSGGQEVDSCENEKNCTVQLSSSTSLQCIVGHREECNRVQLLKQASVHGTHESYSYLATISIYKRSYWNERNIEALNFSFTVPSAGIGVDGFGGVMVEFGEASGYHNNNYYKEPICRFFNLSSSSTALLEVSKIQREISYKCIGIGITPSVFHLNVTSVPSWHHLNYVVSWQEHAYHEYEQVHHFYEDPDQGTQKSFWLEQLIAVAVIDQEKIIHAVFQPPKSEAGARFLKVSLIKQSKIVKYVQVGLDETSVTFTDVTPGRYKITVSPQGGVCDLDSVYSCTDVESEYISISENYDTDKEYLLVTVVLACGTVISLLVLGVLALLIRKKRRKNRGSELRAIFLTSLAYRELEGRVTSYFCTFLSVALQTSVTFTLPLLHPGKSKVINADLTDDEMETSRSLLAQTSSSHTFFNCHIILQFTYNSKCCKLKDSADESDNTVSGRSFIFRGCKSGSFALEDILQKIPSKQMYFVTFKQAGDSFDSGIAYTVYEGSEDCMTSEDYITILNGNIGCSSKSDDLSLRNRTDSNTDKFNNQNTKDYVLPCSINELCEDLNSQLPSKSMYMSKSEVTKIEYWRLAVTVFQKAAENQSENSLTFETHDQISDVISVNESVPKQKYVQVNQPGISHKLPNPISQDFSSLPSQNNIYQSDNFAVLTNDLHVYPNNATDLCSVVTKDESNGFPVISCRDDETNSTTNDHNYSILKSMATIRNECSSFYDSYSNLTDAENDIKEHFSHNQPEIDHDITKLTETLPNVHPSFVYADKLTSDSHTLHKQFFLPQYQRQTREGYIAAEKICYQPSTCTKNCDHESLNTSQMETVYCRLNHQNTCCHCADCKDALAATDLIDSGCGDRFRYNAHSNTSNAQRDISHVHSDSSQTHRSTTSSHGFSFSIDKSPAVKYRFSTITPLHRDPIPDHRDITPDHRDVTNTHRDTTPAHLITLPADNHLLPDLSNKDVRWIVDNVNDCFTEGCTKGSTNLKLHNSYKCYPVEFENSVIPPEFF